MLLGLCLIVVIKNFLFSFVNNAALEIFNFEKLISVKLLLCMEYLSDIFCNSRFELTFQSCIMEII